MSACKTCDSRRSALTMAEDDVRSLARKAAGARDEKRARLVDLVAKAKDRRIFERDALEQHLAECQEVAS